MNAPRTFVPLLLAAGILCAQETPAPAPAAPPAQTEMQKWIATTDAQWQAVFKRDVTAPAEAEQTKLWQQFLSALETGITKATGTGNLDLAVAWRNELERFSGSKNVPAEDELGVQPAIKQLRAGWRTQNATIQKDRADRAKAVHARYDQVLAQAQAQLTQHQRIDDALLVKAKRDEIAAAWIASGNVATVQNANPPGQAPAQAAFPPKVPSKLSKEMAKYDITKVLAGNWHFHWTETGFDLDVRFRADGTFTEGAAGQKNDHKGTWTIAEDTIVMTVPKEAEKIMYLPLDPTGTRVKDMRKNRNVVAVKKSQ